MLRNVVAVSKYGHKTINCYMCLKKIEYVKIFLQDCNQGLDLKPVCSS